MNVLHPTTTFPQYDGDHWGPFVRELCEAINDEGVNVEVLASNTPDSTRLNTPCKISRFNYFFRKNFQTLMSPPGLIPNLSNKPWRFIQLPFFYNSLASEIKKRSRDCDLVHAHWLIPTGFAASRNSDVPVISTVWGAEYHVKEDGLLANFVKYAQDNVDQLVAVSDYLRNKGIEEFGCDPDKIKTIPNAVNIDIFNPDNSIDIYNRFNIPEDNFVITTVRRLVPEKRVQDFIKMASRFEDNENISFLIVGDGPERSSLESLSEDLGVSDNVVFTGFLSHNDIPGIMAESDLFVMNTEQEGMATALLESMASGTPPVATRGTGNDEVIDDGENGVMYETGDIDDLYDSIKDLVFDDELIKDLGVKARTKVEDNFSYSVVAEKYVELYENLV